MPAQAQQYPSRPVTVVVPFAAGGGSDLLARLVTQKLEARLGKAFIVENRPGAGTTLAAMQVVRAAPDGYTLMQGTSSTMAINVTMNKKLPYEPLKDLVPVALLSSSPFFLVVAADSPFKTVADVIAAAKAKPNGLNYGSGGPGSMHHLSTELLQSLAGIQMTHVPYKATPPAMTDLIAGHIQLLFGDTTSTLPMIQQGKLRGIAVTTAKRSPAAPDIPTVAETVPGYEGVSWFGLFGPAGMPAETVAKINGEIRALFADPEFQKSFVERFMFQPIVGSPEELTAFVRKEEPKWRKIIADAKIKVE
jgi:tripartite-type tricarboxylate transporter receptor subunit TctC